ncbi:uncharacterized protein BDW43DRAFT_313248 [Aspergillus alliaceus]|uniref:uncharacterized protein n=1 Tax=Petromyces alliaceus TaxID=209559 RepID=UPI0012A3FF21|nr:uncharacterized protein BDW43DRAFT_313248 [Aspergillus alliaceus]KAB8231166.1 hypothetical protein BDW43DRAFT_313248 [Aspergillus alliaceus]
MLPRIFVIGSERGLTGRFVKHFCDPVIKVLATTQLSNLTFGDYHAADPSDASRNVPDVVMLMLPESEAMAVGKLKTFWTVRLERHPISDGYMALFPLEAHLGNFLYAIT